ncbi:MAG: hypothetical protein AAF063_25265 [Cyanobacteria bacterium J06643_5]
MLGDEDCRTAVFGKTERPVGWEGNDEILVAKTSEALCRSIPSDNRYALS